MAAADHDHVEGFGGGGAGRHVDILHRRRFESAGLVFRVLDGFLAP